MALNPCLIATDNGKIETARLAIEMACRTPFVLEWEPRGDAHAKPVVESMFKVINSRLLHRLEITTKNSPDARGAHNPDAAARRLGMDADRFERALMQALYDVYVVEWHKGAKERPEPLLKDALGRYPVRTWDGDPDELRRLLRRDEGTRLVDRHGVSYKGEWYGAEALGDRLGTRVRIKVDEDDVRTIDAYDLDGVFLATLKSDRIAERFGRPVSAWELELERKADAKFATEAHEATAERRDQIAADLETVDKQAAKAARKRHHGRRAAETATADAIASNPDVPQAPKPSVPRTLALPAPVDEDFEVLIDPADAA